MKTIILALIATISLTSFSQDDVIVIDKKALRSNMKRERKTTEATGVMKFAPLNMLAGEINFGYEHMINDNTSFDIELGPTISEITFGGDHIYYYDPWMVSEKSSSIGFVTSVGLRYYPSDDYRAPNGFYVSPKLRYKLMNSYVEPYDNSIPLDRKMASNNKLGFYFDFGYQLWVSSTFSLDFYTGLGIGIVDYSSYSIVYDYDGSGYTYSWQKRSESYATYLFNIGLKVGITK